MRPFIDFIPLLQEGDPLGGPLLVCTKCGQHIHSRHSGVHHAKRHVAAGEAQSIPENGLWPVEFRYAIGKPDTRAQLRRRHASEGERNG